MITRKIPPASIALVAALLFGASTPAAKLLVGQVSPQFLAGCLYLGSGIGLSIWYAFSRTKSRAKQETSLQRKDVPWLAGAILFGGVAAPLLLMIGLSRTESSATSLLLNVEAVFTALLAWFAFRENFDRRIFIGMVAIVLGSLLLVWKPGALSQFSFGSLAIIAGCFCWAMDNNLTRKISDADPVSIAAIKGLAAGLVNTAIAFAMGQAPPSLQNFALAGLVGFLGYGVSLVLFIMSLRLLGTARTGAYFSTAPFSGTLLSIAVLHEPISSNLIAAALLMGIGVWLHATETHSHQHTHEVLEHDHMHTHDEHHQHQHPEGVSSDEPHSHWHRHEVLTHSHPHYPDTHHRHDH